MPALVEHIRVTLPAIAVDRALANDADVLEGLMRLRVARQGIDQRGRAHGGGIRVLDVARARVILGPLGPQQGGALGDFQGHVALEVQRPAPVCTGRQQYLAACAAGIDGTLDSGGVEGLAIALGAVASHIEQCRNGGGALYHHGAVGRLLAVAIDRAHGEAVLGIGLEPLGREAVNGNAVVEAVQVLLVEPVDIGFGR
ncbi:hypothetical protein D3C80_1266380 [compost metagenome]